MCDSPSCQEGFAFLRNDSLAGNRTASDAFLRNDSLAGNRTASDGNVGGGWGAAVSILCDVFISLGLALQKLGHKRLAARPPDAKPSSLVHQPVWVLGLLCMIGGEIGNLAAYGDRGTPTAVITAVGCVGACCRCSPPSYAPRLDAVAGTLCLVRVCRSLSLPLTLSLSLSLSL